ncbi:MAG: DUF4347 domain-containing protein [Cyanobacteria bacterium P01_A01_bin.83]
MSFLPRQFTNLRNSPEHRDRRGIVFINGNFSLCEALIQQISPKLRVIVIGDQVNGIKEISRILDFSCCREIYIIAQGSPGCLYLGNTELSLNTLINNNLELKSWFRNPKSAMLNDHRLSLYGSNVAAGDVGSEFIGKLSSILGATIAASPRVTQNNILN